MVSKIILEGLNWFHSASLTLTLDVDQDSCWQLFGLHERPVTYPWIISKFYVLSLRFLLSDLQKFANKIDKHSR